MMTIGTMTLDIFKYGTQHNDIQPNYTHVAMTHTMIIKHAISIMAIGTMTFNITTLIIMTISIITFSIMTQHKNTKLYINVPRLSPLDAWCCYAECRCNKCRGALTTNSTHLKGLFYGFRVG
jgi:hypothetical protein